MKTITNISTIILFSISAGLQASTVADEVSLLDTPPKMVEVGNTRLNDLYYHPENDPQRGLDTVMVRESLSNQTSITSLPSSQLAANYSDLTQLPAQFDHDKHQTLKDIYSLAQQHDPSWAAARYANTAAQEKLEQGKALLRPTVNFTSSYNYADTSIRYTGANSVFRNNNQAEKFDTLNYGVNLNQPIYRKQNSVQYQQSAIQVDLADLQLALDRQDLMLKSTQAYFEVLLAQDKFALNQAQKTAITSQLAQAKANYKAGVATITDVDEAQAKFDVVQSQQIATLNELESKKQAVQILTGQYPAEFASVVPDIKLQLPTLTLPSEQSAAELNTGNNRINQNLSKQKLNPQNPAPLAQASPYLETWLEQAKLNNIGLNIKKRAYELASKEVELNQAGHLPTLDAVASYTKTNANGGINGFGNDLNNATVGLQLQIPLYQGGATVSKVREALANQLKAEAEVEVANRKTELDTRQAFLDISSSISQAEAGEQSLHSALSQLGSTNKGFKVGLKTNVDVLNAQQLVFNARRDLLQAKYNYLLGLVKLKYATGVLADDDMNEINRQLIVSGE